jgi:16S rRNA (cytidine1402-2'-O)-methyltransferase
MKGVLTLVPTPIDDRHPLNPVAKSLLEQAIDKDDIICVEEEKEGRRRWLRFGLPRETIEKFHLYNEHTRNDGKIDELMGFLNKGKNVFLMSDCGLPAFCDPGQKLVDRCHNSKIKVTSTPFDNSVALAVALSGFPHDRFIFEGFVPVDKDKRSKTLKTILNQKEVSVIMDTPYRMKKLLEQLADMNPNRSAFIGIELNQENEKLLRGSLKELNNKIPKEKKEFVMVIGPKHDR